MTDPKSRNTVLLQRSGHAGLDAALAAELGARAPGGVSEVDELPARVPEDVAIVVATRAGEGYDAAGAALESGAHWVDLGADRGRVMGAAGALGPIAERSGTRAVFGAGLLPGLVEPFVRESAEGLRRVNEVLIGVAPGAQRFGTFDSARLIGSLGTRIPMLLGAERTEREALGDERWFEHPAPAGALRSVNVDAPDLELYAGRPTKATSVRVSFSQRSKAERRLLQRASTFVPRGWFGGAAGAAARLDKLASKEGGAALLTLMVRGIDAQQLPRERRVSIAHPGGAGALAALPAGLVVERLLADRTGDLAWAGPAAGWIEEADLLAALEAGGASVVQGDLGGWHGSHPAI